MAIGVQKNTSIIGIMQEVTEGTYVAPASANDFVQPLADGFDFKPGKELIERNVLTSSIGKVTPRTGIQSVEMALPCEFRASGIEGGATDFDLLLKGLLGAKRTIAVNKTSTTGHTTTQINLSDGDAAAFNIGDMVIVKESGAHHHSPVIARVTTPGSNSITLLVPAASAFSNAVVISKAVTYYTANSGHPSLSLSYYYGNEKLFKGMGSRVKAMSLDNFSTGQIASFKFDLEGLSFDEVDSSAPFTPSFDSGLPPILLGACVFQDGVMLEMNEFSLNVSNTLSFLKDLCNEDGKSAGRFTAREVSGSMNPYMDDSDLGQFDKFNANTEFSLFVSAHIPSSVAGEYEMGSVVGIYLPKCITTELVPADIDGILTDQISFKATRGANGSSEEIYIGMV